MPSANRLIPHWAEPAHPSVVKLHDDLIAIYQRIRQDYQAQIDQAFDRVSRQIGFVVTTTLPVTFEIGEKATLRDLRMSTENLKGTLFEREVFPILEPLRKGSLSVAAVTYNLYLIWFQALQLRLRRDWIEPAHFTVGSDVLAQTQLANAELPVAQRTLLTDPFVREPAHWFDPGIAFAAGDLVVVSAIDAVYPELRLADRIDVSRHGAGQAGILGSTE